MKRPFSSRTRPWPGSAERGSAAVTVILLMVVFTGLALAMLHASGIHLKINGYRRFSALLDCASENGLKRGLADLASRLDTAGLLAAVADDAVEAMRDDPLAAFPLLLADALGAAAFPRSLEESSDGMTWQSRAECVFDSLEDRGGYLQIAAAFGIEAWGGLDRVRHRRRSALEGSLGLLAGRLPLAAIPFYIEGELTEAEMAAFAEENGISFPAKAGGLLGSGLAASSGGVLPDDPGEAAAAALNIGVFRPGDLSPARLRQALGLETSTDPVPEGVYLIRNDLGLGGTFVQGDLEELVLAVRGDAQIAVFRAGGAEWRLEWSPARSWTEFVRPEGSETFELVPLPIIFVNGAVAALGGGAVGLDGRVEMAFEGTTPAVLDGVDLAIVSADRVTIASHLVLEGVRWQDGIPYSRDSKAQLIIHASGQDVVTGEATAGGIAVGAGAPETLKLQASLTAAAGGFRIEGSGKAIEVLGALHADAYEGNGSRMSVVRDDRAADGNFSRYAPRTPGSHVAFCALAVLNWKEY
ncbi:MAG TPA: hypothetical protein ENO03_07720 [Candidatus Aminicenantes bacterium]|nr:hypothetical protein [Candidatus Aminicenantes bacterium]HDT14227.1 hypothetical protein [Candidatus Aminicenantes bacterium]